SKDARLLAQDRGKFISVTSQALQHFLQKSTWIGVSPETTTVTDMNGVQVLDDNTGS
ncbi:hypothetical protein A2U01_0114337, partial [Trifolium medium]|nr:hypothetical protein [Trifolium medium]